MKFFENEEFKCVRSDKYNYDFNKQTGFFVRWGKTLEEDPIYSPIGSEILDCEITTKCSGIKGKLCKYCYKSNTPSGDNMSLETFKQVVNNVNQYKQLTQVAFGLGSTAEENPELWNMCTWLREQGIIPNGTVADISDETADKIASLFGACAISYHGDKDLCYDNVKKLTDRGMKQVNIHFVIYDQNFSETLSVFEDIKTDPRLEKLNALVLLSLKTKGRAKNGNFTKLSQEKFTYLVDRAFAMGIPLGFDSCSCNKFLKAIKGKENEKELTQLAEGCESFGLFSAYVNVYGQYFPCSFTEGEPDWEKGFDLTKPINFCKDVWFSDKINTYRKKSLKCNRDCILFDV